MVLGQTSSSGLDEVGDFNDLHVRLQNWRGTLDEAALHG
jgi:hypothetical protein